MAPDKATDVRKLRRADSTPAFTPERANRALVLVRRIVADIVSHYRHFTDLRRERERLLRTAPNGNAAKPATAIRHERMEELNDGIDRCTEVLHALNRELLATGCVLKDWRSGLVDFPAMRHGRRVWLSWQPGEPLVAYWHEGHEGRAGRLPIDADFN